MNRTTSLFRSMSLGFASLAVAASALAGSFEQEQLSAARELAMTDAMVAVNLQAWVSQHDTTLMAQADGLVTNDMRADAEMFAVAQMAAADGLLTNDMRAVANVYAVAQLAEADGLVTAQLLNQIAVQSVTRLAAADGLAVEKIELALSMPESSPATRNHGAVLVASKAH